MFPHFYYNYSVTCDGNAEFKGGECICNGNYTGDGITCTRESDLPDRRVAIKEHR